MLYGLQDILVDIPYEKNAEGKYAAPENVSVYDVIERIVRFSNEYKQNNEIYGMNIECELDEELKNLNVPVVLYANTKPFLIKKFKGEKTMTKNHTFIASDILTPELMNGLTQDSQIVSASAKQDNSDSIATTQWVRSAAGDTALNAATAAELTGTLKKIQETSGGPNAHSDRGNAHRKGQEVGHALPGSLRSERGAGRPACRGWG